MNGLVADKYLGRTAEVLSFRNFNKTIDNWPSYAKELKQYFLANGIRNDNDKRDCLLRCIASDTLEFLQNLFDGRIHEKCFEAIITALCDHCTKDQCILEARLKFYQIKMKEHQTYPEWEAELRKAAEKCWFQCQKVECTESYIDNEIRDMIVLHTPHDSVRVAALKKSNPSLNDVLQLASSIMYTECNAGTVSLSLDATALCTESPVQIEALEIQKSRIRVQMKTAVVFIVGYAANRDCFYDDIRNIFKTFKYLFNAEITDWTNLNKEKLREKFKEFTNVEWRKRFANVDFVTIFCLAHGQEEGEVLFGNRMHDVKELLLKPLFKIKELDKKLKWLVVQACRGKFNDPPSLERDVVANYYPDYYVISYCTGEGTISWQLRGTGKIFVQSICKELLQNAENVSLHQILLNVNTLVKEYGERQLFRGIPAPELISNYPGDFCFHKRPNNYVKISL